MLLEFFPLLLILIALGIWFKNHARRKKRGGGSFFGRGKKGATALEPDPFEEKWEMFAKYDPKVRAAIEKVRPAGKEGLGRLKALFKASDDRSTIGELADKILAESAKRTGGKPAGSKPKAARARTAQTSSPPRGANPAANAAKDRPEPKAEGDGIARAGPTDISESPASVGRSPKKADGV